MQSDILRSKSLIWRTFRQSSSASFCHEKSAFGGNWITGITSSCTKTSKRAATNLRSWNWLSVVIWWENSLTSSNKTKTFSAHIRAKERTDWRDGLSRVDASTDRRCGLHASQANRPSRLEAGEHPHLRRRRYQDWRLWLLQTSRSIGQFYRTFLAFIERGPSRHFLWIQILLRARNFAWHCLRHLQSGCLVIWLFWLQFTTLFIYVNLGHWEWLHSSCWPIQCLTVRMWTTLRLWIYNATAATNILRGWDWVSIVATPSTRWWRLSQRCVRSVNFLLPFPFYFIF